MMIKGRGIPLAGLLALAAMLFGGASSAFAGPADPLPRAPLGDVHAGMGCEARTVLKGTAISSFDVEILDVVKSGEVGFGSLIYFRITDPDLTQVGVAQGMSGSPILCPIGGQDKVVGAISYGFAGAGPKGFATPIEDMLDGQLSPAGEAARAAGKMPSYGGRKLVELTTPLTVTGVPAPSHGAFRQMLEKKGFDSVVFASPAAADVPAGSPDLAPGGAFSLNFSYGDLTIGAICTISYRDGDDFWGCGHPLDLAGPRRISISGAYVYDLIGDAWSQTPSFKFGTATATQVGSALYDGPYAVSGRLGAAAPTIPVRLNLKYGGGTVALSSQVADEDALSGGSPSGFSLVGSVAAIMASQAQYRVAGPPFTNGRICIDQKIIGAGRGVKACSRFDSTAASVLGQALGAFVGLAAPSAMMTGTLQTLVESAKYKALRPGALRVSIDARAGSAIRQVIGLRPLGRPRAGSKARVQVISADRAGRRYRQVLRFRIPRGRKPVGRGAFRVESGAYESTGIFDGYFVTTDNDSDSYQRYAGDPLFGSPSIYSPKQLSESIQGVFGQKAKIRLRVPWRRKPLVFPMRSGRAILVGGVSARVPVLPPRGGRSSASRIR